MNLNTPADPAELRRRAEARLQSQAPPDYAAQPAADAQRLLHELQVHQIELEMQNQELRHAQTRTEAALARYTELYDFSLICYFTFYHDGTVREANLTGAKLLGLPRTKLVGHRFDAFVSVGSQPAFKAFLDRVFASHAKESCEVVLLHAGKRPLFAQLEAISGEDGQACRVVVTDITAHKQTEEALRLAATVFSTVDDAVVVTDKENKIITVNRHHRLLH